MDDDGEMVNAFLDNSKGGPNMLLIGASERLNHH